MESCAIFCINYCSLEYTSRLLHVHNFRCPYTLSAIRPAGLHNSSQQAAACYKTTGIYHYFSDTYMNTQHTETLYVCTFHVAYIMAMITHDIQKPICYLLRMFQTLVTGWSQIRHFFISNICSAHNGVCLQGYAMTRFSLSQIMQVP